jgi:predicted permease
MKADAFFRRLLGLYPADFRAEWGGEMEDLFAQRKRREPLRRLLLEVTLDTCKTAPKEHLAMLVQDIRYSARALANNPGFTAIAVLSIALGVGANSSIYALAQALLLRPLAIQDPSGLLRIDGTHQENLSPHSISHPDFLDFKSQSGSFQSIVAAAETRFGFAARPQDIPQLKLGAYVSADFFDVLGVPFAAGRPFRANEDEVPSRDAVAILSHSLWSESYQSDPSIIGRKVILNGTELTIVGVTGASFGGLSPGVSIAVYVPIMMSPTLVPSPTQSIPNNRAYRALALRGRLRPGVTSAAASAEIATLARNLAAAFPDTNRSRGATVRTELENRIASSPPDAIILGSMLATTLLVLLLACLNVANLLLARAKARAKDVAVRLAIGASRTRLLRELMTESFLIALAGGILGVLFAIAGARFFSTIRPPSDFPLTFDVRVDTQVLLFALLLSVASALLFGLVPAFRSLQPDLVSGLKGADQAPKPREYWGRHGLAAAQVAISCILLIAAAMLITGIRGILLQQPGFRTEQIFIATIDPQLLRYTPAASRRFFDQLLDRVRTLPGVRAATLTSAVPTASSGFRSLRVIPEGFVLPRDQQDVAVLETAVAEDYFNVYGIPLLDGRPILRTDDHSAPLVAIVNQTFANKYWPGQSPIGKRLMRAGLTFQVIGLARDSKYVFIAEAPTPAMYIATRQEAHQRRLVLSILSSPAPSTLLSPVREVLRSLDANLPLAGVSTMAEFHERRSASVARLIVQTMSGLGGIGLILALVGLYGTISYSVSRRTREIGIRLAIGAAPASILGLVIGQGAWIAGIGIGIGTAISIAAARSVEQGFLGLAVAHPAVFFAVPILLAAAALAACWLPARRAASTQPTRALRCE